MLQIGRGSHVSDFRIEPQIVVVWIKDDWHPIVDGCGQSIWSGGQDREGSSVLSFGSFERSHIPAREQRAFFDFKTARLLETPSPPPLIETIRWHKAPATRQCFAECGLVPAVYDLALIIWAETEAFFAHEESAPRRTRDKSRRGSFGCDE
jgi:hypothetical protein